MNKPKAIVFDYGGTLVDSLSFDPLRGTEAVMEYARNPFNITPEQVQKYAEQVIQDMGGYDPSNVQQLDGVALNRLIHDVHGLEFDMNECELDAIFLDVAEETKLMTGLIPFLDYLKRQGIRLAVLSNTGFREGSHRQQLRKYGIEHYFEFFLATSDYLVRKPDKRIFDVALMKLGLTSEDVWYVGNKFEYDVQGAFNAGLYPVWINVAEKQVACDKEFLDVKSYHDLLDVLEKSWN